MSARALAAATIALVAAGAAVGPFLPAFVAECSDYHEYAAAARLLLAGENPYDWNRLLPTQQAFGWTGEQADMMWNPPWVFPVVLPLGLVPWDVGHGAWAAAQLAAVLWAAWLAWNLYGGPAESRWVVVPLILAFPPLLAIVRLGQIPGFMLLGLVGFLAAWKANRFALAGVAAAATAIKPHLLLPFGVLLACDSLVSRRTRTAVLAGGITLGAASAFPMLWNPDVWPQWRAAISAPGDDLHYAPSAWVLPTIGYEMRMAAGDVMWVQFIPSVVGTAGLVAYWWVRRKDWDWLRELPPVTLVSVLTTGYGAMGFDQVVLLLPIVQAAAWVASERPADEFRAMTVYVGLCGLCLALVIPILWWAPVVLGGYVAVVAWSRGFLFPPP